MKTFSCLLLASLMFTFSVHAQIQGGPKIRGPWLWCMAPTNLNEVEFGGASAALSGLDFMSRASNKMVTEDFIATEGASIGDPVGDNFWTYGLLDTAKNDNINDMLINIGIANGNIDNHVAYGSIIINSHEEQNTLMFSGSDDAVKIWLNGKIVHENFVDRSSYDYQDVFRVTLKAGENVLLVAVYERSGSWSGFFGFDKETEYEILPPKGLTIDGNSDGKINKTDLILILLSMKAAVVEDPELEDTKSPNKEVNDIAKRADVNKDGIINIIDLQHVIDYLDDPITASAPSIKNISDSPFVKGNLVSTWGKLKTLE